MNAKEMFKKLGYECIDLYKEHGYILYLKHQRSRIENSFLQEKKSFKFENGKFSKLIYHNSYTISGNGIIPIEEETRAIHQQMIELKWLNKWYEQEQEKQKVLKQIKFYTNEKKQVNNRINELLNEENKLISIINEYQNKIEEMESE